MGLPFFAPAYDERNTIHFYSPVPNMKDILEEQMRTPYFPIPMTGERGFKASLLFHTITPGIPFSIGDVQIDTKKMCHPGDSYAYSFIEGDRKFVYTTDVELSSADYAHNEVVDSETVDADAEVVSTDSVSASGRDAFFDHADVLVLDAQYTMEESMEKENWGHSTFSRAVDFSISWNVDRLFLFHHEPVYDDKKLYSILQSALWYANDYAEKSNLSIYLASEGMETDV
jgi:phosphoribosyl 1,2-cyclic phosphodiesterase